jgi:hypothetical protein
MCYTSGELTLRFNAHMLQKRHWTRSFKAQAIRAEMERLREGFPVGRVPTGEMLLLATHVANPDTVGGGPAPGPPGLLLAHGTRHLWVSDVAGDGWLGRTLMATYLGLGPGPRITPALAPSVRAGWPAAAAACVAAAA